ncbi:MAG: PA2778 family cysteine peptidase, partial [Desulfobulbales bacterium]
LFTSSGCSLWRTDKFLYPADQSEEIFLAEVPFFQQETYQCGPSSLAMVLAWTGLELTPNDLTVDVYTPVLHGSLQPSLISAARLYGRIAYPIKGLKELFAEINDNHPVIVLQNLGLKWYPKWHYAVVIGYENSGKTIILHSGMNPAERLSIQTFQNTWSRSDYWGLLVLPPDELPAIVTEEKYLNAVAGLERTGQFETAISAYRSAISRWPQSLSAWMGLGNSFYAQGDLSSAASAFKQAMQLYPSNGMPINNFAQVLWEQGKKEQAMQAIRHAIELGGPFKSVFEETLQDFEQNNK